MILLHQTIEIVDEAITGVLGVLEVLSHVDGLDGTHFLAHAAEDAAELVDLVYDGVPVALEAIHVGQHFENAEYSRDRFVYDLDRLMEQDHPTTLLWDPADPRSE